MLDFPRRMQHGRTSALWSGAVPVWSLPCRDKASVVRVSNGYAAIAFDGFDACEQKILFEYLCRVGIEKRFSIM